MKDIVKQTRNVQTSNDKFSIIHSLKNSITIRKIAYMAVFTSASVALTLIFNTFIPLILIQSFRVAFAGIFVKISGLFMGPIIGGLTGLFTDLFLLILRPTDYHPGYTLVLVLFGVCSGFAYWIREKIKHKKSKNTFLLITIMSFVILGVASSFIYWEFAPTTMNLYNLSFLELNKDQVITLIAGGLMVFLTTTITFRIWYKNDIKKLNDILLIICFNTLIDFIISQPLISFFDRFSVVSSVPFISLYMTRLGTTVITVLWNTILIFALWDVIQPIIWRRLYNNNE